MDEKAKCPYCGQEFEDDGTISIPQMQVNLCYVLYQKTLESLREDAEPAVLEQARLLLETMTKAL